ncbi:MAG: ABC transporter permease [Candidatus Tectomicrobia bacterium]|uniref:ABC transporter permease n=1 Tax=Tectimicrobiota bacterium TaxID=2528274 RepID=A0A932FWV7_UNCTE|nr:ABC transporter permease [Candidatus Tectomicrobia bacterium]
MIILGQTLRWIGRLKIRARNTLQQMQVVGVNSLPVVLITGLFTGMVLALQSFTGFKRFGAESQVGAVVAISMTRELGPVLTGLIVSGRAGAAMAAQLGTMRVTEQIDALQTLAVNPVNYLVVPRFLAGLIMLPVLTVFADAVGILGGYIITVGFLGANSAAYLRLTTDFLELNDIYGGLLKAAIFGMVIAQVSCLQGFYARGGAEGVGRATTRAVVISSMLILILDYFLTWALF